MSQIAQMLSLVNDARNMCSGNLDHEVVLDLSGVHLYALSRLIPGTEDMSSFPEGEEYFR